MGNKVLLLDLYEGIELKDSDYGRLFKGIEDGEPEVYCVPKEEPDLDEIVKRNNNGNSFFGKMLLNYVNMQILFYGTSWRWVRMESYKDV